MTTPADIRAFLASEPFALVAELTEVRGSSPRDAGTFMLIGAERTLGTIGGGALEYMVIDRARQAVREERAADTLDVPLGPQIGQCCGGRVTVGLRVVDAKVAADLVARAEAELAGRPHVFVFGAGHVGRALAEALALLPVRTEVIDTRPDELAGFPPGVTTRAVALPEAVVREAPPESAFVILTHDHALDFLIVAEALGRRDAAYIGMVGSASKRAKFASWYKAAGGTRDALGRLVCPIGAQGIGDKRPAVIAALAAAEIMVHIGRPEATSARSRPVTRERATAHGR